MPGVFERLGERLSRRTGSLPLLSRLLIGSAVLAVLVGAAFALALLAMSDLRSSTKAQAHSKDVSTATLELESVVNQLDSSLRGYVNSGNPIYLAQWRAGRSSLPTVFAALNKLVASEPVQAAQAQKLATDTTAYVNDYGVPLIPIFNVNPKVARSSDLARQGLYYINTIRRDLTNLLAGEDRSASEREAIAKREASRAVTSGIAALILSAGSCN